MLLFWTLWYIHYTHYNGSQTIKIHFNYFHKQKCIDILDMMIKHVFKVQTAVDTFKTQQRFDYFTQVYYLLAT